MATVANEIIAHMIAAGVGTAEATDWFIDIYPNDPDVIYVATHSGGPPPTRDMGSATWTREFPSIQLRFRGAPGDSDGPRAKAQTAFEAISTIMVATLSGTFYYKADPIQSPFKLMRDSDDRTTWVFNINTEKELS